MAGAQRQQRTHLHRYVDLELQRIQVLSLSLQMLLLVAWLPQGARSQLSITAITAEPSADGTTTNALIGSMGSQIAGSLLASGTPAMLWGVVPQDAVDQACKTMAETGTRQLTAHVDGSWGTSEDLTLDVTAIGGCLTPGAQAVFTDNTGRTSAIVCDTTIGCGVYMTGPDVSALWEAGNSMSANDQQPAGGVRVSNCASDGATWGSVTGVMTSTTCLGLLSVPGLGWIAAAACVPAMIGVNAGLNAAGSCAYQAERTSSCFPGDALVLTQGGAKKAMRDVAIGDKVAVWSEGGELGHGAVAYEEIYAFGHKDMNSISEFVKIDLGETSVAGVSRTLELSALHFVPTISEEGKRLYKRAKDVRKGDVMLAMAPNKLDLVHGNTSMKLGGEEQLSPYIVTGISSSLKQGLFNPFTMHGTILVNNVVASVHSEWFLDTTFDKLGISHWLPATYQMILSPARALYKSLNKANYARLYAQLDNSMNFEKTTNVV